MKYVWGFFLVFGVPMAISFISVHLTLKSIKQIALLQKIALSFLVIISIGVPWILAASIGFQDKLLTLGAFLLFFVGSAFLMGYLFKNIISKNLEISYKNSLKIYVASFSKVFICLVAIVLVVKPLMLLTKNI
jgi:hypothetical protein